MKISNDFKSESSPVPKPIVELLKESRKKAFKGLGKINIDIDWDEVEKLSEEVEEEAQRLGAEPRVRQTINFGDGIPIVKDKNGVEYYVIKNQKNGIARFLSKEEILKDKKLTKKVNIDFKNNG